MVGGDDRVESPNVEKGLLSFAPKVACSHIQSRFVLPITRNGRRRRTVTDCDTYGRRLCGGYGYRFKKSYESTLAILVLPL